MAKFGHMGFKCWALASAAILSMALPAHAQEAEQHFNIPPQSLSSALNEFGQQSGRDILFSTQAAAGKQSPGVQGSYTPDAALRALLAGTGLEFRTTNERTFLVAAPGASPTQLGAATQATPSADAEEEIVVTGSRLRGGGATPVTSFGQERIKQLGAVSVADVLNYVPQRSLSFSDNQNFAGGQSVQLRGLGIGTTLVLVNGRRTVSSALQGSRAYFDVNSIPLPAVQRIEVLSNSASAVYGADAVAGVVNIILRDEIEHPVVDLYYGFTPDGGSDEKRASVSFGLSSGRLRSGLTLDYFERTPLYGFERDITADQDFRRFGGTDQRTQTANPGNVFSTTAAPLPGLTSTFAAVSVGSSGIGLTPADFLATQGALNLESTSRFASIIPAARRQSAVALAQYDLTDWATIFGEIMYVDRDEARFLPPSALSNVIVPASNAFNPFGVPVRVSYLVTGLGLREETSESEFYRTVAGIRGDVGPWSWELAGLFIDDTGENQTSNVIDPARRNAALASSNPATALNPFQDGPGGSPAVLASILANPAIGLFGSTASQGSGQISGPLFDLPGGAVEIVLGGEVRNERFEANASGIVIDVDRDTESAFAELRVPLISPEMNVPLVQGLVLAAAGRHDRYSDFGETFNPQLGVQWIVDDDLMGRASWGTSFRPPSLFELYQPELLQVGVQTIVDPRRNNETYIVDLRSGGDTNLNPEEADAYSAGFVLTPSWVNGFRLTVDYWRVEQELRVQRFTPAIVVNNESTFPDRVVRGAPTPADVAAGLPGRILMVDARNTNFGGVETDGVDLSADFSIETNLGTFTPSLSATYINSFLASTLPGQMPIERAGRGGAVVAGGSIPQWKAVAALGWSWRGLELSAVGRYTASYDDVNFNDVLTGRRVDAQFTVDGQISMTFDERTGASGGLEGVNLRLGVFNLFDEQPPFSQMNLIQGFDSSQSDLRGRFVYFRASKNF